jgi:hypothetical protein
MQKPAVFTAPFAKRFSSPSLRSGEGFREGICTFGFSPHPPPQRPPFWKTAETSAKNRRFGGFFVDAYGMRRIKLLSLFQP